MAATADASPQQRLAKVAEAQVNMKAIMTDDTRFKNECEEVFTEFRRACMHLRRDQAALDMVEDKETCARFMCKFCKSRPLFHSRCEEVLRLLVSSEEWTRTFLREDVQSLPPAIAKDLQDREPEDDGGGGRPVATIVVQRCSSAKVLANPEQASWTAIGRGLVVYASFTTNATKEHLARVARFILTARLSVAEAGGAASLVELACQGEEQSILVVPQSTLASPVEGSSPAAGFRPLGPAVGSEEWLQHCRSLEQELHDAARQLVDKSAAATPRVVFGPLGESPAWELKAEGGVHTVVF